MKLLVLIAFLFVPLTSMAQDFSPFQSLIDKHLVEKSLPGGGLQTSFNYDAAKSDSESQKLVAKQLDILSSFDPKTLTTKEAANAFWINTYNFLMINIILDKGFEGTKRKINSVKDLGSFFSPYKIFKKEINSIGGKNYSLDGIEKGILLGNEYKKKGWKDARIHFAVNCASVGCPPLAKAVYSKESLDKTLSENVEKALKTPRHLHVKGKTLFLTHLFKWYEKDFSEASGSVKKFLVTYTKDKKLQTFINKTTSIEYITYDWNLNRPENF